MNRVVLKVLCLHGYRQSGAKFRGKLAAWRKCLQSTAELCFVDAPFRVPYDPTTDEHIALKQNLASEEVFVEPRQFSWWQRKQNEQDGSITYEGIEETILYLQSIWEKEGPFDGILGFSQGGMCATRGSLPFKFQFAIFVSASAKYNAVVTGEESKASTCIDKQTMRIDLPTLHIMGKSDDKVEINASDALASQFLHPTVFQHAGGHYAPSNKDLRIVLKNFIQEQWDHLQGGTSQVQQSQIDDVAIRRQPT